MIIEPQIKKIAGVFIKKFKDENAFNKRSEG